MSGAVKIHPLKDNQRLAVAPEDTVWLSASAGTGKTQVLSSRVLRLLLQDGVDPSQILCLTFTKAGATEMAARVNATLATWVRLSDEDLFRHLEAIGATADPDTRAKARTLFAAVLDCPGGGLRIDTIHAFAQWLLAAFPAEAGLIPGTRPMEDRDRDLLARQVLAQLLLDAEARGDAKLLDSLAALSLRMAPEEVERFLLRCAGAYDLWLGPASWIRRCGPRSTACSASPPMPTKARSMRFAPTTSSTLRPCGGAGRRSPPGTARPAATGPRRSMPGSPKTPKCVWRRSRTFISASLPRRPTRRSS